MCVVSVRGASMLPQLNPTGSSIKEYLQKTEHTSISTALRRLLSLGIVSRAQLHQLSVLRGPPHQESQASKCSYAQCAVGNSANFPLVKGRAFSQTAVESMEKLDYVLPALQAVVPPLSQDRHKGQAGKIAVIGGCREYTGAPYFSAISALKLGADLSHVFCTQGAATVIKSYSPELIVHPILEESYDVKGEKKEVLARVLGEVSKWMERFDCLVVGPGLGRDTFLLECVAEVMLCAKQKNIPMVIDGDGLFLITNHPELICGYPLAILTPNVNEHNRLVAKVMAQEQNGPSNRQEVPDEALSGQLKELAQRMGGLTIVQKGKADCISDGYSVYSSTFFGSPRRCGGQGDVLSGSIAVFMSWARQFYGQDENSHAKQLVEERLSKNPAVVSAVAGSLLLRKAASEAFKQHKRSMVTTDIIEFLGSSMEEFFPA